MHPLLVLLVALRSGGVMIPFICISLIRAMKSLGTNPALCNFLMALAGGTSSLCTAYC